MGIGNQLEIYISRKNLKEAKEKIYMMLEGKMGLKEKKNDLINIENKYEVHGVEGLNDTSLINFENSTSSPDQVVIVIKAVDAQLCINLYNASKEAVDNL